MNKPTEILIDTDIANYILKGDEKLSLFAEYLNGVQLVLSFVSAAELYLWGITLPERSKRESIDEFIHSCRVIFPDLAICGKVAEIAHKYQQRRRNAQRPLPRHNKMWHDFWIAGTAMIHRLPLLTNNLRHYIWLERFGLHLLKQDEQL